MDVGCRLLTQPIEVTSNPSTCPLTADFHKLVDQVPVGVQLTPHAHRLHHIVCLDAVNQHAFYGLVQNLLLLDQLGHKTDRTHLAHERRVEADLVDAVKDLTWSFWHIWSPDRIYMDDHDISAVTVIDEWEDCRVAHIPTIPIVLTVDFDCLEQKRQTSRSQNSVGSDLVIEDAFRPPVGVA